MKSRIDKIMKAMQKGNLDAIAVIAGPNMEYLTGGDFFLMERPTVLIFSKNQRPLAILPSLEVDSFEALNFDSEIVAWKDSDGYLDAFVKISEDALEEVLKNVKEGITESELAQMLIVEQYNRGAHGLAVHPLVLIGGNSSLPHGHAGNRKLKIGDALLFDFGCIYNGYISDFTRTYFFKEVSDSFRKIYAVVKEANEIGRNLVKIGTSLHEIDDRVTKYLENSPYSKFIGHRTGHGLGMEIHEDPSVVRGNYLNLQNGMVITIEPGLYDKGNVGIRIEDNVVVTENGHESLTVLPRELIVL